MLRKLKEPFRRKPSRDGTAEAFSPSSARATSPLPTFPNGVDLLHDCSNPTVDIYFVHGLTGDRRRTWTAEGQKEPWLKTLLPAQLPNARILTYGYDAYVIKSSVASVNRLKDHANNLLNDVSLERLESGAETRPIIFVAHSLGGLVCKEAILLSRNHPEAHLCNVFNCVKAIMFLGTPHAGSWMASWAQIPASWLGIVKSTNRSLLKILETGNEFLESLQSNFLSMFRGLREGGRQMQITCFYEELPLPAVEVVVVDQASAIFPGLNSMSIHADHRGMTKFSSINETGFKRLLGELKRWESEISSQSSTALPRSILPSEPASFEMRNIPDPMPTPRPLEALLISEQCCTAALKILDIEYNAESEVERAFMAVSNYVYAMRDHTTITKILVHRSKASVKALSESKILEDRMAASYKGAAARCLQSLSFPEMGERAADIEQPATDTCTWIYENSTYREWEDSATALLWVKGKPGSGKSTLMKSLFKKRSNIQSDSSVVRLSFFFNAQGSDAEKTPLGMYATLLHELLATMPLVMCEFLPRFLKKEKKETAGKSGMASWRLQEVADIFHAIITQKQSRGIEIMIDALDECKEEEVRKFVSQFELSIERAATAKVELRVCWSSRYYPTIRLSSDQGLEILLDKQNEHDIRQYLKTRLTRTRDTIFPSIYEEMVSRANGVFLWAVVVSRKLIQGADRGKDETQLLALLRSIPTELEDLFDEIFFNREMCDEDRHILVRIAQWIFCAFRPLALLELSQALSLQASNTSRLPSDRETSQDICSRLERKIVDLSGGLFELSHAPDGVQVIHESVQHFFLGVRGLEYLQASSRELFMDHGHKALALCCFKARLVKDIGSATKEQIRCWHTAKDLRRALVFRGFQEFRFLADYVHEFVFYYFHHARSHIGIDHCLDYPLNTSAARRQAFENFFRLELTVMIHEYDWDTGSYDHIREIESEVAAFQLTPEEFFDFMEYRNTLLAVCIYFRNYGIRIQPPRGMVDTGPGKGAFLALFYISKTPDLRDREFFQARSPRRDDHGIKFCFALALKFPANSSPLDIRLRAGSRAFTFAHHGAPTYLQDWEISKQISDFPQFKKYSGLLDGFPRAKICEHQNSWIYCMTVPEPTPEMCLPDSLLPDEFIDLRFKIMGIASDSPNEADHGAWLFQHFTSKLGGFWQMPNPRLDGEVY